MGFGSLIERAARMIWTHKFLAALGVLDIVLTSSGLTARVLAGLLVQLTPTFPDPLGLWAPIVARLPPPPVTLGQLGGVYQLVSAYGAAGWIALIGATAIIVIVFAVIGIVIEGGIIAVVGEIERVTAPSALGVFASGWRRALPMVIIASVPAIPLTLGAIVVIVVGTAIIQSAGGLLAISGSPALAQQVLGSLLLLALATLCPLSLITWPLELLSVLAYRACMLDHQDASTSFRRAWGVLRARPGPVLVLVALSYGVSLLASALAYVPDRLALVFLPAIVIVWLIGGVARTFYLTLWTLGWQALTAGEHVSSM
jgi:hypothetical protein